MPLERAKFAPALMLQFTRVRDVVSLDGIQKVGSAVLPREYVPKSGKRTQFEFRVVVKGEDGKPVFEGVMKDPTGIELEAPPLGGEQRSNQFDRIDGAGVPWGFFVLIPDSPDATMVELYSRKLNHRFKVDDSKMVNDKPFELRQ